ncbi:hypothetical protein C8J56DRAFT_1048791 [Mycena floridula]|nr:hypothetical protein C8J56DRAFT_1048791 [Mycena floridula]
MEPIESPEVTTERLRELIHSNQEPVDFERAYIRNLLDDTGIDLPQLLDSGESNPILRHYLLAVLHPIRKMPKEVFGKIFLIATEEDIGGATLCHQYTYWHQSERAEKRLFASIRFGREEEESSLELLQLQLGYSSSLSLDIVLPSYTLSTELWKLLISESRRWKGLEVTLDHYSHGPSPLLSLAGRLDLLSTLTVDYFYLDHLDQAPIPWNQITKFGIFRAGLHDILGFIRRMPQIVELILPKVSSFYAERQSDEVMSTTLRRLTIYEASRIGGKGIPQIMAFITAPNLEFVDFEVQSAVCSKSLLFTSFFQNHSASLRHVCLRSIGSLNERDIGIILKALPRLRKFAITGDWLGGIMEKIIRDEAMVPLVENLVLLWIWPNRSAFERAPRTVALLKATRPELVVYCEDTSTVSKERKEFLLTS